MSGDFSSHEWEYLLQLIRKGMCTPFIGAGASIGALPTGRELAEEWAKSFDYPLSDSGDLARVAQYLAINIDGMFPKNQIEERFRQAVPPDFSDPNEPHIALAKLELPIYITTNYDNYMADALTHLGRPYKRDFLRWNEAVETSAINGVFDGSYVPSPEEPLVYHLHGYYEIPRSLVLTESDYLEFLIKFATKPDFLPSPIRTVLAGTSLMFVGYSLNDYNFRVLFRGINSAMPTNLQYSCIAIQLPPEGRTRSAKDHAKDYLLAYMQRIHSIPIRIYWGEARGFMAQLMQRWDDTT